MKKIFLLLLVIFTMSGCGGSQDKTSATPEKTPEPAQVEETPAPAPVHSHKKILIAYFSRTGEEYNIGTITKGNTAIVAELIGQNVDADIFEIRAEKDYPAGYEECKKVASHEKAIKARPKFVGDIDISGYEMIFIGYPIWYGDAPQIVYTFLESYDFGGKKIIPFCTSGGSGLSSTDQNIQLTCPNATVLQGFEIHGAIAQKDPERTEELVIENLERLGLI